MEQIGKSPYLNLVLVSLGARNAYFMIEYDEFDGANDYDELVKNSSYIKAYNILLERAINLFPSLVFTKVNAGYLATLEPISKEQLEAINNDEKELGRFIDYPCYGDWDSTLSFKKKIHYNIGIYAMFKSGKSISIFNNMCSTLNLKAFENIASKYYKALLSNESPVKNLIKKVEVEYQTYYPLSYYTEILKKDKKLSRVQTDNILNELLYFGDLVEDYRSKFDTSMGHHRGILLSLISLNDIIGDMSSKGPVSLDIETLFNKICSNL